MPFHHSLEKLAELFLGWRNGTNGTFGSQHLEELILQHNPGWTMAGFTGIYEKQIEQMPQRRMRLVEQFCYDHLQTFTHEQWRGRIRTCNGVGSGVLTDRQVDVFDRELAAVLEREFPDEPLLIEHRVWAVITQKPRETSP